MNKPLDKKKTPAKRTLSLKGSFNMFTVSTNSKLSYREGTPVCPCPPEAATLEPASSPYNYG
jgi:hypothetical protein